MRCNMHVSRRETFDIYALFVNTEVARELTFCVFWRELQISLVNKA